MTGAVKRKPKYRNAEGTPPPTALRIARAANPNVDKPCRITPLKPASEPTRGSVFRSEILRVSRRGGAVRTDMKRVVIARETVDQSLFGQRLVIDDPVRSAVAWNGHMLRWGCYAVGEGLSRDLCSQVERCGLVGR
jgi:hypothetical protein